MNKALETKLKDLPRSPGVYFHKSVDGEIIYVGKAAVLKNRVRQYFQSSRDMDAKTRSLVEEIVDTDWVETESEIDALFLESEMVKRYMPRYNVLLRDDKSQLFVRIDMKNEWPTVSTTRHPLDDGADYFGPYYNGHAVKKALRYLRKVFPYYTHPPQGERVDLDVHLGLSPRPELSSDDYKDILRRLVRYMQGGRKALVRELEKEMKLAARLHDFENAAALRNRLRDLNELQRRIMFGDKEFLDISKDRALSDLKELLGLDKVPKRIEGFDISHMGGTNVVASMVVFNNGASDRAEYRKFKTRIEHNNDFYNMNETIRRRFSEKNIKAWGLPDLVLIDGGKGQLDAAIQARDEAVLHVSDVRTATLLEKVPFIGLAKREEQIVVKNPVALQTPPLIRESRKDSSLVAINGEKLEKLEGRMEATKEFVLLSIPHASHIVKLLQRIRDESHRFAVSYHTTLKRQKQTASTLEEIPGIGPATRKKLIRTFGSMRAVKTANAEQLAEAIGPSKAEILAKYLSAL
jgi:excinuclease ABC subunit C